MKPNDAYRCWEIFLRATHILSTAEGNVKERLAQAGVELVALDINSLPEKIRPRHSEIMKALTIRGDIRKTVSTMRKVRATKLAEEIMDVESELRRICYLNG